MTGLAGSQSYYYDALYRLTNPNYPGQSDAYMYDANGNRTLYNEVQYSYDAADQLTCAHHFTEQCPSGGTVYGYDANGNQTSRGSDSFTYDHENRLTQSVIGGVSGTYTYKGDGLRVSRNIGGTSVSYTWDVGAGLPVILQDSQGNTYVYGLDLISRTDSGGNQEYYLYDGLGSTADLTNGSGTTIASYSYDVFGAIRSQSGSSANYWLFTGEQRDGESGMYYLRARYYDPSVGRFLSQDPAGAGHPYAYVENNPVNYVDRTGLWGCPIDPTKCVDDVIDIGQCALDLFSCPRNNLMGALIGLLPECTVFRIGNHPVSCQLLAVCASDHAACAVALGAFPVANRVRDQLYDHETREGTIEKPKEGDAFQHCFWSGLITLAVGPSRAKNVTSAYEASSGNDPFEREYDLANNKRGREFAQLFRGSALGPAALEQYCTRS